MGRRVSFGAAAVLAGSVATACASTRAPSADDGSSDGGDGAVLPGSDAAPDVPPTFTAVVYAHSPSVLYELDAIANAVRTVRPFTGGCSPVIDIALDESSRAYVTTFTGFYKLDLATATCTLIANGNYPNSLSFVPKGTLDPNDEALVGYFGSEYVRIDVTSGAVTTIGMLGGGYYSSGDIVSVIGGGTFLTVNGDGCYVGGDCLFQVDPKSGDMVQNYGSVSHESVYGLAFWAGTLYGFDNAGGVFAVSWQDGGMATKDIPVPGVSADLQFWGAGSTTAAPATGQNGDGIPTR